MPRKTRADIARRSAEGIRGAAAKPRTERLPERQAPALGRLARPPSAKSAAAETATPLIVGIGASAGGLEALGELLTHLPDDTNMAFVIVQHLAPGHESMMSDLLARKTRMSVLQVRDGTRIQPNSVYVIPPSYEHSCG